MHACVRACTHVYTSIYVLTCTCVSCFLVHLLHLHFLHVTELLLGEEVATQDDGKNASVTENDGAAGMCTCALAAFVRVLVVAVCVYVCMCGMCLGVYVCMCV